VGTLVEGIKSYKRTTPTIKAGLWTKQSGTLRLGRVTVLCSWETHFALTVPLSTLLYECVLIILSIADFIVGNPAMD